MSDLNHAIHRKIHFWIKKSLNYPKPPFNVDLHGNEVSHLIRTRIEDLNTPFMLARFGVTEINIILIYFYRNYRSYFKRFFDYYTLKTDFLFYDKIVTNNIKDLSGFFPLDEKHLDRFGEFYLECSRNLDLLASFPWVHYKMLQFKNDFFPHCPTIDAEKDFEPFNHDYPWTTALKGKKVLIVHPFAETIKSQYPHLNKIFPDGQMPEFELKTFKAVQSLINGSSEFNSWFDAYDYMREGIDKIDYDVAILGCGAYGFPLASHIKDAGKRAIHLGGATQVLFGIKGNRYDNMPSIARYYNQYWVRPGESDRIAGQEKVENACYW